MFCKYCGKDIGDAVLCPHCNGQAGYDVLLRDATHDNPELRIMDVPNIFLIILAFFVPLFGIIYYFARISKFRVKSRAYGIASLCGVITNVLISIIALIIAML